MLARSSCILNASNGWINLWGSSLCKDVWRQGILDLQRKMAGAFQGLDLIIQYLGAPDTPHSHSAKQRRCPPFQEDQRLVVKELSPQGLRGNQHIPCRHYSQVSQTADSCLSSRVLLLKMWEALGINCCPKITLVRNHDCSLLPPQLTQAHLHPYPVSVFPQGHCITQIMSTRVPQLGAL